MPNFRKWSTTATSNASIAGGVTTINWAEGQPAASVNNSMREASAQVRSLYKPSEWGWVEHSSTASVASQTTVKVAANVTADYTQGRRLRLTGGSAIRYADIVSASFTAETTVTLKVDSGSLSASMSIVAVAAAYDKNLKTDFTTVKLAAETVNNSDTLQNDDELFFPVAASTVYTFEMNVLYTTAGTADFKFDLDGPAAATSILYAVQYGLPADYTSLQSVYQQNRTAFNEATTLSGDTISLGYFRVFGILTNGVNAGIVRLRWAQASAVVSDTIVRKGSLLRYSVIP